MKHLLAPLLLVSAGVVLGFADADKEPDIKEIMKRANRPTGIYFNLKKDLEDEEPDWNEMSTEARELARLAAGLSKQKPPKGDKEAWTKRARAYAEDAKSLSQAVAKKDKKAARAAITRMGGNTCKNCHAAHKAK
jgi:hypothetical protein